MYPSSPPHYREDILHHRLYLEEEFLQQSVDLLSMGSSDSETSSNGDASCELSSTASDLDSLLIQTCTKQEFSDYSWVSLNMGHADRRCDTDNSIGHVSDIGENISINEDKPSSVRDISNDGGYGLEHIASQEVGGIEKRRGKWKLKRELISLSEDLNTEPVFDKPNGSIEVIETELKDTYRQRKIIGGEAATNLGQSYHDDHSSMAVGHYSCTLAGACFLDLAQDEHIMDFFHQKVVNFSAHETFEAVVRCECIFGLGTVFQECEVAILRSCTNKLYILLIDATPDGQDISKLLGCYRFEEMRKVVVGLGLQALRIYLEGSITYLFLTRSSEKSKSLLSLLRLCDSAASDNICPLKSWEQVQVKMLEKYVCEYLKMGIFFYSMLLFCHENSEGESWFRRSIFVVEGNMLVCSENFIQFGSSMDNWGSTCPYYSLDSCCAIQDILEMVIEFGGGNGSLTLTIVDVMSDTSKPRKWKLKWYSRDTLLQFVALLKAIHSGWTAAPLTIKCAP